MFTNSICDCAKHNASVQVCLWLWKCVIMQRKICKFIWKSSSMHIISSSRWVFELFRKCASVWGIVQKECDGVRVFPSWLSISTPSCAPFLKDVYQFLVMCKITSHYFTFVLHFELMFSSLNLTPGNYMYSLIFNHFMDPKPKI